MRTVTIYGLQILVVESFLNLQTLEVIVTSLITIMKAHI